MRSTKSADQTGHIEFLPWGQFDGCSVTRPFLSTKGVACETTGREEETNGRIAVMTSHQNLEVGSHTTD